jgi:DNA recombination protein RmuC
MLEIISGLILAGVIVIIILLLLSRRSGDSVLLPDIGEIRSGQARMQGSVDLLERGGKEDASRLRLELAGQNQAFKLEVATALKQISDSTLQKLDSFNNDSNQKIELLRRAIGDSGLQLQTQVSTELEKVRVGVMQASEQTRKVIDERLEQMRQTVDEKLQATLEARLGESFRTVTEQLQAVHTGLGEMQALASGVGDLKRVLTNVRARGMWGEVQLDALLQEMLRPEQYGKNVAVTGTNERVEFAIRLPGRDDGQPCGLPIDAKFPSEDYQRILDAADKGDAPAVEKACRGLETTLRGCASQIKEKYISEPQTTGFAILFLATEGLYSEVLRRPGFAEDIQRTFHVMIAGPSTFGALLTSLRVGFQTLTIEQKASEIRTRLLHVKTAFEKYSALLGKAKKKLQQASDAVEIVEKNTTRLQKALDQIDGGGTDDLLDDGLDEDDQLFALAAGEA